jgi:hypothetical protein
MDVAIPQPGQYEAPVEVDHLGHVRSRLDASDRGHSVSQNQDVLNGVSMRKSRPAQKDAHHLEIITMPTAVGGSLLEACATVVAPLHA